MENNKITRLKLTSAKDRSATGNYIDEPAALEIEDGPRKGFDSVIYAVRRTVMDATTGGIVPAVYCLNDNGGKFYPIDTVIGGDLYFDEYGDGNGQFSSRGIRYKIRPLLPEEKPQYI